MTTEQIGDLAFAFCMSSVGIMCLTFAGLLILVAAGVVE